MNMCTIEVSRNPSGPIFAWSGVSPTWTISCWPQLVWYVRILWAPFGKDGPFYCHVNPYKTEGHLLYLISSSKSYIINKLDTVIFIDKCCDKYMNHTSSFVHISNHRPFLYWINSWKSVWLFLQRKLILKYAHKYRLGLWRPRAEPVKSWCSEVAETLGLCWTWFFCSETLS